MDFDKNFERNEERKEESNGGDEEALRGHIASGQGKDFNRLELAYCSVFLRFDSIIFALREVRIDLLKYLPIGTQNRQNFIFVNWVLGRIRPSRVVGLRVWI